MYKLSCDPDQILYVAAHKTLHGKGDRTYDDQTSTGMHQILLTIAEILLTLGVTLPEDHERSAADSERLVEAEYENLMIASCMQRNGDLLDGETL